MASSRRILAAAIGVVLLAGLPGCGASRSFRSTATVSTPPLTGKQTFGGAVGAPSDAAAPEANAAAGAAKSSVLADRLVIRNANVRLEVPKVPDAAAKLQALAGRYGGIVSNLQLSSDTGGEMQPQPADSASGRVVRSGLPFTASLTVLVPVAKSDAFRADAEKLGKVLSESSADDDVTQQHVDLQARLANARAEEARLRSFFDQAKSVTDMLSIERELTRVRGDIESMTAQLATMERQAAMATLTIELVEPKPIVRPASGVDWGFGEAVTSGVQGLAGLLNAAIVVLIATAPLWLLAVAALVLVRWRLRVRRARSSASAEVER